MNKITKQKFIALLKNRMNVTNDDARYLYETFISICTETLLKGDKLILAGFGTFYLKSHKGHIVRNKHIDDYLYVKFITSHVLNNQFQNNKDLFNKIVMSNIDTNDNNQLNEE